MPETGNILQIKGLTVDLLSAKGIVHAVRGIDLALKKGKIHGFVGESGCGKTMTAKSILRLHDEQRTEYGGSIEYEGRDILRLGERELQALRGKEIAMIFQDPMVSLNPLLTVGEQIGEMLRVHLGRSKKQAQQAACELLEKVGIFPAEKRYDQYPFEFSGGMLQRIMIAIAISCGPKILIADEPTTALDVTIQAQILELVKELQKTTGMTVLFITHNFGVVAEICDRVSVMYAGRIVETGGVLDLFRHPSHPYSAALIESIPKSGRHDKRLVTIPGAPPQLLGRITGCAFADRCRFATDACRTQGPPFIEVSPGHTVQCHNPL